MSPDDAPATCPEADKQLHRTSCTSAKKAPWRDDMDGLEGSKHLVSCLDLARLDPHLIAVVTP